MFKAIKIVSVLFGIAACGKLRLTTKASNDAECASVNCYCADKGYWSKNGPTSTPSLAKSNSIVSNSTNGGSLSIQNVTYTNTTVPLDNANLQGLNATNYPPFACNEGVSECFNAYGNCKKLDSNACGWDNYSTQLVDCLNRNAACRRVSVDSNVTCVSNTPITIKSTQLDVVSASAACYDQDNIRCLLFSNQTCGWNDLGKVNRCLQGLNVPILTKQN